MDPGPKGAPGYHWWPMYRKILDAGKSVQVLVEDNYDGVVPLLKNMGGRGIHLLCGMVSDENLADFEALARAVEPFRP